MHAPAVSHRPARHILRLPSIAGVLDDAHQFWPARSLADWPSGDHHRHSRTRTQPYPAGLLGPGTGA